MSSELLRTIQNIMMDGSQDSLLVAADLVEEAGYPNLAEEWRTCRAPGAWRISILSEATYMVVFDGMSKEWNEVCSLCLEEEQ